GPTGGWVRAGHGNEKDSRNARAAGQRESAETQNGNQKPPARDQEAPSRHQTKAQDHGKVAQYAWAADYHGVVGRRLERLASAVRELVPDSRTRCYVDAGPVPERELAQRAGLGWIGKNTMLIHPKLGSFTFIGVILTDAP